MTNIYKNKQVNCVLGTDCLKHTYASTIFES